MDKHKGLGHVMDFKTPRRRVWRITNFSSAFIDLYMAKPETWLKGKIYLSCVSLEKALLTKICFLLVMVMKIIWPKYILSQSFVIQWKEWELLQLKSI